jgi:diguanylate cyclase (GGDEF)-like protein
MASQPAASAQRARFSVAYLIPVALCLIAAAAASIALVIWSAAGVDQRSLEQETALARHAIATQLEQIPHEQESSTLWDDAVTHVRLQPDNTWIDNNLGIWMHDFFGYDEVIILDGDNQPFYAMRDGRDVDLKTAAAQLPDLRPLIAELRRKLAGGGLATYLAGKTSTPPRAADLATVDGVPSLISIVPIASDTGKIAQPRGGEYLHIAMIHLGKDYAARLSDQYFIPQAHFGTFAAVPEDDRALLPLTNNAGRFVTFFEWQKSKPGAAMLRQTIPAILGALLVAALVSAILLRQLRRKSRALDLGRAEAEYRALHDALTDLPNRINFERTLGRLLAQRPSRERRVSVLMLDLDRFKQVNDTLGHAAGDDLLEAVGQRLRQFAQRGERIARLGADEFALLLVHQHGYNEPTQLARRIIDAIGKPFDVRGSEAFIGVSIGIATADGDEIDSRELLRKADIALYEAKVTGRNHATVFEESMNELLQNRHTIEAELREALRRPGQLAVAFQPLYGADHHTIIGAEALARWTHPSLGQVSPAHFIPVAEASGLIETLGEFVLREACEKGAQWPGRLFAVNISPVQLRNPRFPERVFKLLSETRMRPADLELEITEGILLEDASVSTEALEIFRSAGIRIALDDFGTGYSSLNYLKRYPVDRIKIDRSFVSQLTPGSVSIPIVQAMVSLAHALKIEVTAEGVETPEQIDVLATMTCNAYQGFLLSPPVTPTTLDQLLRAQTTHRENQVA